MHFIARLPTPGLDRLRDALAAAGVVQLLRDSLVPRQVLHQSLSCFLDTDSVDVARRIGSRLDAGAFDLVFDRVVFTGQLALLKAASVPNGFSDVTRSLRAGFRAANLSWSRDEPAPHMTLAYGFTLLAPEVSIEPLKWHVDRVELVQIAAGHDRYRTLDSWLLGPVRQPQPVLPF